MLQDEGEAAEGLPAGLEGERAELARMVEEYQKLDAEDYVGGIPTRFRYREVRAAHSCQWRSPSFGTYSGCAPLCIATSILPFNDI